MKLIYLEEPLLKFGKDQIAHDPHDGLTLFGPFEPFGPYSIKAGLVGPTECLQIYSDYVNILNQPIFSEKRIYGLTKPDDVARPSYPGFSAVFGVEWNSRPEIFRPIDINAIEYFAKEKIRKKRVNQLVNLYIKEIKAVHSKEDVALNVWIIVVPHSVYVRCRPASYGRDLASGTVDFINRHKAGQIDLKFPGEEGYAEDVISLGDPSNDFHNLLKARLIQEKIQIPAQIFVENTLKFRDKYRNIEFPPNMKAHLAWTQSTTLYYKLGKLPWKLSDIREGVCYIGLIFKKVGQGRSACSAAQMFLRDGDGTVFRGNIGLWATSEGEFHLGKKDAKELVGLALDDYHEKRDEYPQELFIHGRARFSFEEWEGFQEAVLERSNVTTLVGVVIKESHELKLFRDAEDQPNEYGALRGLALLISDRKGYLLTRGFIPQLSTATSLEVPNPISVEITHGDASLQTVLMDILSLTKLNYNACIYGDGLPVTLKFSDRIGSILVATDSWVSDQRQFKYYI